jgi:hypothetical protein
MSGSVRRDSAELLAKARREHEKLEEKLGANAAFRAYLACCRSGRAVNAHLSLANNEDFARWYALDGLLEQLYRGAPNRTLH